MLSYVREHVDDDGSTDTVLCVNNLSRFPQPVELDLRRWEGVAPVELLGGVRFPQIGELPYLLTLGGYGFYWFRLPRPRDARVTAAPTETARPVNATALAADDGVPRRPPAGSPARAAIRRGRRHARRHAPRPPSRPAGHDRHPSPSSTPATGASATAYQMPLSHYPDEQERLEHASSARWTTTTSATSHAYDAVHDRERDGALPRRLRATAGDATPSDGGLDLPPARRPRPRPRGALDAVQRRAEQLLGRVRRGQPDEGVPQGHAGPQPRHRDPPGAHRGGATTTSPRLYGWIEAPGRPEEPVHLAMLQQFLRTASDGWDLALASVRNLFAEADLHADEVGGDFAGEAHRLGVATAEVHAVLAEQFPTETWGADELAALADAMRPGWTPRSASCPSSAEHADALREIFAGVGRARHAGVAPSSACTATSTSARRCAPSRAGSSSTSRASRPSRSPSGSAPTPAWRDVAGMLRSFDYAAHAVEADVQADERRAHAARAPGRRVGRAQPERVPRGYVETAGARRTARCPPSRTLILRAYERRQGRLRSGLRGPQPPDLARHPAGRHRAVTERSTAEAQEASDAMTHTIRPLDRPRLDLLVDGRHGNPHDGPRRAPARRRASPCACSGRWPSPSSSCTAARATPLEHEHEGVWAGVLDVPDVPDYRLEVTYAGGSAQTVRRPLPLPAHPRARSTCT